MFLPSESDRRILNSIYTCESIVETFLFIFTTLIVSTPIPKHLTAFRRLQLGILINSFMVSVCIFIERPVMSLPLAAYSVAPWPIGYRELLWFSVLGLFFMLISVLFINSSYAHRAHALCPVKESKKRITIYFVIVGGMAAATFVGLIFKGWLVLRETEDEPLEDSRQYLPIREFSEVVLVSAVVRLLPYAFVPVGLLVLMNGTSVILIAIYSRNARTRSRRAKHLQDQLFKITMLQSTFFQMFFGIPIIVAILRILNVLTFSESWIFYLLTVFPMHSIGNCMALVTSRFYRGKWLHYFRFGNKRPQQPMAPSSQASSMRSQVAPCLFSSPGTVVRVPKVNVSFY